MNSALLSPSPVSVPHPRPEVLESKPHFDVLDGLRGIAALAVVVFHFMEWVFPDARQNFIGHGFLAVDFFFCLSGFVIGYAYDDRLKTIGVRAFFTSRLIRLHPWWCWDRCWGWRVSCWIPLRAVPEPTMLPAWG